MSLSVVLPVFDDQHRLPASLTRLAAQLAAAEKTLGDIELIIVDDASRDDSVRCVAEHLDLFSRAQLIRLPWSCGTGTAVRAGVAAATGSAIAFMDDDHRVDVYRLTTIVRLLTDADLLVSPRPIPAPSSASRPNVGRRISAGAYAQIAKRLTTPIFAGGGHRITALRAEVAKTLFSLLQSRDFAFDVETRVVATSMGLRIVALPGAATGPAAPARSAGQEDPAKAHNPRERNAGLRAMVVDLLHANGHRERALNAGASGLGDGDKVIDLTDDESSDAESIRATAPHRQDQAGA